MPNLFGAVDLGGTNARAIVADLDGRIAGQDIRPSHANAGLEAALEAMSGALAAAAEAAGTPVHSLRALGVASPGSVDVVLGVVGGAPQLIGWKDVPLVRIMSQRTGIATVLLENDASAAALGEHCFGAGRGLRHLLYLTMSTGVGGGIIIDGQLYRGARGAAGELGHILIDPDGPECAFCRRGCLESLASGAAIARRGEALIAHGEAPLLERLLASEGKVSAELVVRAALQGDAACRALFLDVGRCLGIALAGYVNFFNPQLIAIGGGVSYSADLFLPEATRVMTEWAIKEPLEDVRVVISELGEHAGMLGMIARIRGASDIARGV